MAGITEADKRPRGYSTKIQIILVYIVTGSRSRRVYASLDVYKAQQTSFLTFLVEVHDLVVCFVQKIPELRSPQRGFVYDLLV